ncbi:MAG: hypothetical protein FWD78_06920 [Treponema sp.]|nr:hypothetical protein [Treponema sp.]
MKKIHCEKINDIKFSPACLVLVVLIIHVLGGCGSYAKYNNLAKEHDFKFFFPSASFYNTYDNVDEAYDFVNTALLKFGTTAGKSLAKGIPGKLDRSDVNLEKPVTVACFIDAYDSNNRYVSSLAFLAANNDTMENIIRTGISATVVFLVFYEDRAISIAGYYLKSRYTYQSSSQHKFFTFMTKNYIPVYPLMWSNDKAFQYLRKEID